MPQVHQTIQLTPLTTDPGVEQEPSLSPDGSQVAYSWNGPDQANYDIYVKTTKAGAAVAAPPLRLTRESGRRHQSSVVAGWKFDRIPA